MNHPLACQCGKVQGTVSRAETVNRGVCYCRDCQAFAHFLQRPAAILDPLGGTDIMQTVPANVTFNAGVENLACMRLTERGLLRWYAACCNTPIGNTPPNVKLSFIGLVHACLGTGLDAAFGPIRMHVHTDGAKGQIKPQTSGLVRTIMRFGVMVLRARLDGSYLQTPFFAASGVPVAVPKVLSAGERSRLMSAL